MNNVLELRGKRFVQASKRGDTSPQPSMNGQVVVTSELVNRLQLKMSQIVEFWQHARKPFDGILISVYYNKIAAKSNRISGLFKGNNSNKAIVGAKFNDKKTKHIITYFLDLKDLNKSIDLLSKAGEIINSKFPGGIDKAAFDQAVINKVFSSKLLMSKSLFRQVVADISYIEDFEVEQAKSNSKQSIITLYDTKTKTQELLKSIGIDILASRILDNQTVFLDKNQVDILFNKVPYLVSMSIEDLASLAPDDFIKEYQENSVLISSPGIEPTIGVIDTLFDKRVYFGEWVEYHDMVDDSIPKKAEDYRHGTAVSSIIVDGARLNPWLDDGCGRFKVRHFGVAVGSQFSSFTITKQIQAIILENRDIKVWNISLGSNQEINDNFISAEAAVLDKIQFENDIIFVVAGTNKPNDSVIKIGSPADSINSMVVNAVTRRGLSTRYARKGLALSFFSKPDVSYYGGSEEQYIKVCEPTGAAEVAGTSYAAPWIARKLSYLIDVLGLNREIAKAMIIDAARDWNENPAPEEVAVFGHGIVPIKIEEIVQTKDDEIKFLVSDVSEKWNTYNYNFPVPLKNNRYPFIARATMCYFPMCNRTQGVDYTNTELNLHFGRMQDDRTIKALNTDKQNQEDALSNEKYYILEGDARKAFRKWDNVKYIAEKPKKIMQPKKSYNNKNWGMEIKTNNRLDPKDGVGVRFGVVVTLKEIRGVNRLDEFIKACTFDGWLVKELDVKVRIDTNEKINEDIVFE